MALTIVQLVEEIRRHQALYDEGKPELTDEQFDVLVEQLRVLSPKHPQLNEVGNTLSPRANHHLRPMLSLEKCKDDARLKAWTQTTGADDFVVQPKIDGLALALTFKTGVLVAATTRGNGTKGDDVLVQARKIGSVVKAMIDRFTGEVRGEVVMPLEAFENWKDQFTNPRNLAAGVMMRKHQADVGKAVEDLIFVAYDAIGPSVDGYSDHSKILVTLQDQGWLLPPCIWTDDARMIRDKNIVVENWGSKAAPIRVDKRNPAWPGIEQEIVLVATDGLVVKVNNRALCQQLGSTAHHPKWAIAYKFAAHAGVTYLRDVQWQVGKNSSITPIAIVDPVQLSGAMVSRASLHNPSQIEKLDLCIGAKVEMVRRGQIIPQIDRVLERGQRPGKILLPKRCPSCRSKVCWNGKRLACSNPDDCAGVLQHRLRHWAVVTEMDRVGPELVKEAYEAGLLRTPLDFYRRTEEDWREYLSWTSQLSASSIQMQINRTRQGMPISIFLEALSIDKVGPGQARRIEKFCGSWEKLIASDIHDLQRKAGIGPVVARRLFEFLEREEVLIELLLEQIKLRVPVARSAEVDQRNPFAGRKVVFTGALSDTDREGARQQVRELGGETPDAVTMATDILVVGDGARDAQQGKREKAERYNAKGAKIEVIDEAEYARRLAIALELVE